MLIRGGTSKGAYFLASDLPSSREERDALLLSIMGSPHPDQIDGIGGGHPLRSKVAIVAKSTEPGVDIDFLFAQVAVDKPVVDTSPNCGNILAGIGPFAIERGLIKPQEGSTTVRVKTLNTGTVAELVVSTPNGVVSYEGDARIDGVPGTSAPILVNFLDVAGSVCGSLLPTGNTSNIVEGIRVTCLDNGMPVVLIPAAALDRTGYESVAELNADSDLKTRLEILRKAAGQLMGLGDVSEQVIPKLSLIACPKNGGSISTRNFIPRTCHTAIGVFAAVTVATACVIPGSVAEGIARIETGDLRAISLEHPTGEFTVNLELDRNGALPVVKRAGLLRTARVLFDGLAFGTPDFAPSSRPREATSASRQRRERSSGGGAQPMQRMMPGFRTFNPRGLTNLGDVARLVPSESAASSRTSMNFETAGRVLPAGACDCHAHVYGPFAEYSLPNSAPFKPALASVQASERMWETFGIERGVIVQGSAYGPDHRALLAAIHRAPENRRGVALVGSDTPDAVLEQLQIGGVRGARMNFVRHLGNGFDETRCRQVVRRIQPFEWHLELRVDAGDLERLQKFVQESSVDIVIDHMGRVDATLGLSQAPFRALLKLICNPHCWVKLSGADRVAKQDGLEAVVSFARALIEVAPDRVVWGTDWPHVNLDNPQTDEALFRLLRAIAPDDVSRTRLLVDNPARLYGF